MLLPIIFFQHISKGNHCASTRASAKGKLMCTHRKSFHSKQALYSYYTPQINEELIILVSICQKHGQYAIKKTCFDYSGHYKWSLYLQLVMLLALYGLLSKILPPSEVFWVMRARFFSFLDDYYGSVCVCCRHADKRCSTAF